MLDEQTPASTGTEDNSPSTDASASSGDTQPPPPRKRAPRKTAAKRPARPAAEDTDVPTDAVANAEAPTDAPSNAEPPADAGTTVEGDAPVAPRKRAPRKTAAKRAAAPASSAAVSGDPAAADPTAGDEVSAPPADGGPTQPGDGEPAQSVAGGAPPAKKAARRRTAKKAASGPAVGPDTGSATDSVTDAATGTAADPAVRSDAGSESDDSTTDKSKTAPPAPMLLFQPPDPTAARPVRKRAAKKTTAQPAAATDVVATQATDTDTGSADTASAETASAETAARDTAPAEAATDAGATTAEGEGETSDRSGPAVGLPGDDQGTAGRDPRVSQEDETSEDEDEESDDAEGGARRRRRRGGRRRRKGSGEAVSDSGADSGAEEDESSDADRSSGTAGEAVDREGRKDQDGRGTQGSDQDSDGEGGTTRRRRRRRRSGDGDDTGSDDPENTVVRVRKPRSADDEISTFSGSTRLEAKKQRRREGREAGRRRAPIISEAEFLARREAVDRKMVIRQKGDLTQIAVLEDEVLVEHYVARDSQTSLIGNVYLGRVQNVLPSMEAAFIDIGKGRNAVLYAGEVNWDALGAKDGKQRKIEQVLKSGQSILVQVSKDPIGHKGARLTSQVSLPGRFLVYVPDGTTSGISRKLPENERNRLKTLLKEIVPDTAGVIVRTAAEGASEAELTHDVERLKALWEDIASKVESGNAPQLLYGEPDLTVKVVRDLFTEDIGQLVISGDEAWQMVDDYVSGVAPDLAERVLRHDDSERDAFAEYRIDEQIAKALDRKVWLPSGGSLVIDRTEAMTVVDVNTGKFTGSGGNLEETVTKNNLEAAEEIVRQLRLRDIGGIIVIDFIDMVLENNRDLVLRRLIECLGRDRTRHQVAEVTSLGLVQMTRKRIGTGLLEAFSEPCEHCQGRGLHVHMEPVDSRKKQQSDDEAQRGRRVRGRGRSEDGGGNGRKSGDRPSTKATEGKEGGNGSVRRPTPAEFAAMVRSENAAEGPSEGSTEEPPASEPMANEPVGNEPVGNEPAATEAAPSPEAATARLGPVAPETQTEPGLEPVADHEPVAPPVPTGPRIVTRVRRSGARRPAGPPASQMAATPEPVEQQSPDQADQPVPGATPEPVEQQSPDQAGQADPHTPTYDGAASADGADVDADGVEMASQSHVPVKRKGSRKR